MSLTEHAIRLRTADRMSFSQATDFILETGRPVDRRRMFDSDISPYCFDFTDQKLLCVSAPDIVGATFFYQAQRERARSVIKVPFEALPEAPESPILIFSIGRCGSTLLHKAFEAAGVRSVSEPDYFPQAAVYKAYESALRSIIGGATRLLPYAAIKLRAECSNAALVIAGAFRAPNVIFILRNAVDWAASAQRVSYNPTPQGIAALLRILISGLDTLRNHYDVRICYYEDFRNPSPEYINALLAWMGSDARITQTMAAELAAKDAQQGSTVSQMSVKNVLDDPDFREAFRREWCKVRPLPLIEQLELRGL